jgi:hypothetical protein
MRVDLESTDRGRTLLDDATRKRGMMQERDRFYATDECSNHRRRVGDLAALAECKRCKVPRPSPILEEEAGSGGKAWAPNRSDARQGHS